MNDCSADYYSVSKKKVEREEGAKRMTVRNGRSRRCREERKDAPRHARPCGDGGAEGGRKGVKKEGKDKSDA